MAIPTRMVMATRSHWSWWLLAMAIIIILQMVASVAAQNYTIGIVLALQAGLQTDYLNARYAAHVTQALLDIQSGYVTITPSLPSSVHINLVMKSSLGTPNGAFLAAETLIRQFNACAIIGPIYSEEAVAVATLGSALKVPELNPSVAASSLSDKLRYDYFIRARPVDISMGPPLLALFRQNQWRRVCMIGSDEVFGRSLASYLDTATLGTDIEVHASLFVATVIGNTTYESSLQSWQTLLAGGCRIFVLHCVSIYTPMALAAARTLNILDNPTYAIIGTMDWVEFVPNFPPPTQLWLRGMMGLAQTVRNSSFYNDWFHRIPALYPDEATYLWSAVPHNILESNWYDSLGYLVQSIANMTTEGRGQGSNLGPDLLAALHGQNGHFTGASGHWDFDSNWDRVGVFDLIQFQDNSGPSFVRVAQWNRSTGMYIDYPGITYNYAGGAKTIARDGLTVLLGDDLTPSVNDAVLVLAFVIGGLSCWCSLILMEQVMYAAHKHQRWWIWCLACAVTQGGPGVWALHIIAISARTWPAPSSLIFDPSWTLASLGVSIALTLAAYYIALRGWRRNKQIQERASSNHQTPSGDATPNHGKDSAASPASKPRGLMSGGSGGGGGNITSAQMRYEAVRRTPPPHQSGYSVGNAAIIAVASSSNVEGGTVGRGAMSTGGNGSTGDDGGAMDTDQSLATSMASQLAMRRLRELSLDRSIWGQMKLLPYRINIWFAFSAVIFAATTVISLWMITQSLPPSYGAVANTIPYILFVFFSSIVYTIAILMVFYFFPISSVRAIAAVLMHAINFVSHIVCEAGYTYSYRLDTTDTSSWWDPTEVVLAVSITTAVLCFVLLAINVDRMKLSRNALDLVVVRFKKELTHTTARVEQALERERFQRRRSEKLWQTLETINLCRPLFRDHALALTLAEHEIETMPLLGKDGAVGTSTTTAAAAIATMGNTGNFPSTGQSTNQSHNTTGGGNGVVSTISNPTTHGGGGGDKKDTANVDDSELLRAPKIRAASAVHIYQQLVANIQLAGPTPDQVVRDVRLEHIVRNPVTLELFKDSMMTDGYDIPNFMLYLDIRRYRTTGDTGLRGILSKEIYDTFITRDARYGAQLSDATRRAMQTHFPPGSDEALVGPSHVNLFQTVEEELVQYIEQQIMPRFSGTPSFNLCALLLNRPQFRVNPIAPLPSRTAAIHPHPMNLPVGTNHGHGNLGSMLGSSLANVDGNSLVFGGNGGNDGNNGTGDGHYDINVRDGTPIMSDPNGATALMFATGMRAGVSGGTSTPNQGSNGNARTGVSPAAMGVAFADPAYAHVADHRHHHVNDEPTIDRRSVSAAPLGKSPSMRLSPSPLHGVTLGGAPPTTSPPTVAHTLSVKTMHHTSHSGGGHGGNTGHTGNGHGNNALLPTFGSNDGLMYNEQNSLLVSSHYHAPVPHSPTTSTRAVSPLATLPFGASGSSPGSGVATLATTNPNVDAPSSQSSSSSSSSSATMANSQRTGTLSPAGHGHDGTSMMRYSMDTRLHDYQPASVATQPSSLIHSSHTMTHLHATTGGGGHGAHQPSSRSPLHHTTPSSPIILPALNTSSSRLPPILNNSAGGVISSSGTPSTATGITVDMTAAANNGTHIDTNGDHHAPLPGTVAIL